jgi:hypothetical protein
MLYTKCIQYVIMICVMSCPARAAPRHLGDMYNMYFLYMCVLYKICFLYNPLASGYTIFKFYIQYMYVYTVYTLHTCIIFIHHKSTVCIISMYKLYKFYIYMHTMYDCVNTHHDIINHSRTPRAAPSHLGDTLITVRVVM